MMRHQRLIFHKIKVFLISSSECRNLRKNNKLYEEKMKPYQEIISDMSKTVIKKYNK